MTARSLTARAFSCARLTWSSASTACVSRGRSSVLISTPPPSQVHQQRRCLANVRDDKSINEGYFLSTPRTLDEPSDGQDRRPSERTLKLGRTVSILHERLPSLLGSPLPSEILSPQISLHLFPSTHPHLPTVSGRIAYLAALWTAPVAWGRVPVVGNVRLIILSERMVKNGCTVTATSTYRNEKLIVKWKTCGKTKGRGVGAFYKGIGGGGDQVDKITEFLGGDVERDDEEFTGLFIFEFDEEGRIVTHTIEHAEQGKNWEKMTRVVSVTDWLLGLAKNRGQPQQEPGLALEYCHISGKNQRKSGRRDLR